MTEAELLAIALAEGRVLDQDAAELQAMANLLNQTSASGGFGSLL